MKILCVVPSYWPAVQFGGPIYALRSLNRSLNQNGVEVAVYTTTAGCDSEVVPNQTVVVDGNPVTYFSRSRVFEYGTSAGWQFSPPLKKALLRTVGQFDLVYIVSVWNYPCAAASRICSRAGKPYVISPRGQIYKETMEAGAWKKRSYYQLVAKKILRESSAIHYTTRDEADHCHSRLGLKSRAMIVPNGIDLPQHPANSGFLVEQFPLLRNKRVILYLGRINWKKGLDILLPAYAALRKAHPEAHLVLAGNDRDGYGKTVRRIMLQNHLQEGIDVTFTGLVNEKEKWDTLSGSEFLVLPSYSENFGNSVLEAMASGRPVIVSNRVGLSEDVLASGAGLVVDPQPEPLSAAMACLLNDSNRAREAGERGKHLVQEKFAWRKISQEMIASFEEIAFSGRLKS